MSELEGMPDKSVLVRFLGAKTTSEDGVKLGWPVSFSGEGYVLATGEVHTAYGPRPTMTIQIEEMKLAENS